MTTRVVIPVKPPETAKLRLSGVLSPAARGVLVAAMLGRVVAAARDTPGVDEIALIGPSRHGLDVALMPDPGGGLNAALQAALLAAVEDGASRLIVLPGDLPQITSQDIALLLSTRDNEVLIAPDRHANGTNALSLPLPEAAIFTFAFGTDSCAAHQAAAARLGLTHRLITTPGLARDIDLPQDLTDASSCLPKEP